MIVINLYAGPGAGKTTQAHDLMAFLKKKGLNSELIPEYAKTLIYKESKDLSTNQISIFNNQLEPYRHLFGKVDVAIAECPLALSVVYNRHYKIEDNPYFDQFVMHEHNRYDNIDIYLKRETDYKQEGRYQDEDGAVEVDNKTKAMLQEFRMDYKELGLTRFCENVYDILKEKIG
jgi:hypothetical protein